MNAHPNISATVNPIARRSLLLWAATAAVIATLATPALAQSSPLDGRRFDGVFLERRKTSGDADTLVFQAGRFRSMACDRYGYGDAVYRISGFGDAMSRRAAPKANTAARWAEVA